ncbi:unnamed protein product (macronuclear) [Paramecium tetraurelia]|uniref:CDC45-like protein n=1 Tax=Paramecium tetraurelia TaxID=5888 RepID=A0DEU0_PARTE|nr:uncharacterized protein GSPATT00016383001 [Paramecium tetraurelia]CAK81557.1 unnamed protein product [Paramecium tetraurelia]|eukprot:XP_001448954.1 hypothetical protein (macronuclear) [Paramecium tetraurelia strain d4-2]
MKILLNNIKECFQKILKRSEFGKTSVCIIVSLDVDAICALRILTSLLNRENLQFRMIPVSGYSEMTEAIQKCGNMYKSIILLNCGNVYDMSDFIKGDIKFFIFDSHKPINHNNVNNEKSIYIIDDGMGQLEKCPEEEIKEMSDGDEDSIDEDDSGSHSSQIQRKQQQKLQRSLRKQLIQMHEDYYSQGTYYSRPSSTVVYTLAQQMNHDCNDHLWYAILGLTDAYIHMRLNQKNYDLIFEELQNEVIRLNIHFEETQGDAKKIGGVFIENEYKFLLMRQQSLYNSMYYSSYVGTKLKLWKDRDNKRLEEFMAKLGIPLNEAKQDFRYMNQKYKQILKSQIAEVASKFQMDDILYRSFVRQSDTKIQIAASDMVYAVNAILEYPQALLSKQLMQHQCSEVIEKLKTSETAAKFQNFFCALDTLGSKSDDLFQQGVQMALEFQAALVDEANNLIENNELYPCKHFRYGILKNESPQQKKFFQHPQSLQKLALLLMDIYKEKGYKQSNKSVILVNQLGELFMVVGVVGGMSFSGQEKNQFGQYFLRKVQELNLQFRQDSFETSVIEIHKDDFPNFIDAITDFKKN